MARTQYIDDRNGLLGEAQGSDKRLNVSSRADGRSYYNSRDVGRTFELSFTHAAAAAGEYSLYVKNEDTTRTIVLVGLEVNTVEAAKLKMHYVTGTGSAGATVTPVNDNKSLGHPAVGTFLEGASGSAVGGLTSDGVFRTFGCGLAGHRTIDFRDLTRIRQDAAIALEYDSGTTGIIYGTLTFYYE